MVLGTTSCAARSATRRCADLRLARTARCGTQSRQPGAEQFGLFEGTAQPTVRSWSFQAAGKRTKRPTIIRWQSFCMRIRRLMLRSPAESFNDARAFASEETCA
jgi:hypothetical protein